ncbi:class A beta-lactamase-related serine hydrolase [Amycolatopsis sp. NBC_00345]|uniref:serine hydrolase n=1 Tax=Amycolatopsis sp. NBC_00345 TaxID=2975955 RepID=UPI002E273033
MLTRRSLLTTVAAAGSAALLLPATARASAPPDTSTPEGWLAWLAAHRADVSVVADYGTGRRLRHRPGDSRVVGSAIKVVHLAAYTAAVAAGRLDPDEPIRLGDWDARHPYVGDGIIGAGSHHTALTQLGVPCDEYGVAKDPEQRVPLQKLAEAMILSSDNAAADYLHARLGGPALRAAAAKGGWPNPDVRMFGGETLMWIFPEYAPPPGTPVPVRRALGNALSDRFARDTEFRNRVLPQIFSHPPTPEWTREWVAHTGRAPAADLFSMHRALATGGGKAAALARDVLASSLPGAVPPGADSLLFKGGSLPGVITIGLDLLAPGRTGTCVLMLENVSDVDFANTGPLIEASISYLATPGGFTGLERALGH